MKIPLIASGGMADGRGMAAALVLGAEGINMGTRFGATVEAPIHERIKQALADASEHQTKLIFRTLHNTGRVQSNAISQEVVAKETQPGGCTFENIRPLVAGARGRAALESGEVDGGLVWAGLVVGLIDDIPTCEALIQRIVADGQRHLSAALTPFSA